MKTCVQSLRSRSRAAALTLVLFVSIGAAAWAGPSGTPDVVIANFNGRNRVCLNNGSGSFTCSDISTDSNLTQDVVLADVDGVDGLDAVFANDAQRNRVCLNNGSGGFTCSDVSTDTNASQEVALADVDGANGLDAVFANFSSTGQRNRVCLNDGAGGFTCSDVSTDVNHSTGLVLGEFDIANRPDAVFANQANQRNRKCLNDGAGNFTCSDVSTDTNISFGVALGDLTAPSVLPVPALSLSGRMLTLMLLSLSGVVYARSRRRKTV